MRLTAVSPREMGQRLAVLDDQGRPDPAGLADLMREAVGRWGLVRESGVRRWAAETLTAAGVEKDLAAEVSAAVIAALIDLREVEQVSLDAPPPSRQGDGDLETEAQATRGGAHLAPTVPRLVRLAHHWLLLGDRDCAGAVRHGGVARWVDEAAAKVLMDDGVREVAPPDWVGAPGWYGALERRGHPDRALRALWDSIAERLAAAGDPIPDPDGLYVLAGRPGGYVGHRPPGGRWVPLADAADGVWCGLAPGYNDRHWRPMAFEVRGDARRSAALWDMEELRWAVLSRGCAIGDPEIATWDGALLRLEFLAPSQLLRVRSLCAWDTWRTPPGLRIADLLAPLGVALREKEHGARAS